MKLYCDLHLHSCLSPCGDDDMTPNNIVNMAKLKGLTCIALTDHNTAMNCRATAMAARQAGLGFIPGMELSTAEDIHLICLFPDCDKAEAFSRRVAEALPPVKNKPRIYGHQIRLDELDRPVGEEETLLLNATMIPLTEAPALVREYGGVCYPAHIDKIANSVLAILGSIPPECEEEFDTVEVSPRYEDGLFPDVEAAREHRRTVVSSDAHYLWDIAEAGHEFEPGDDAISRLILASLGKQPL
ncbi:MAG TPA: PHP domain-containing protein [Firmicutes bacterium]|jgi:3',5'-nucleoside bisphosphate phosphatase|nr:PHP domain-containing protein [Clostridiales bacterium]HIY81098.1 PHP domain-containing protein [Bacillota bacterium]